MSSLCANTDTEDISWEEKTMPNRKQAATASFCFSASQLPEQTLEQRYTGKHTSAYSKHSQLFLPVA